MGSYRVVLVPSAVPHGRTSLHRLASASNTRAAATKALEIDETQSEAHAALGLVKLNHDWDGAGAEAQFRRAIALNPSSIDAHDRYAAYGAAGPPDEGRE